ncbi:MAG TPA: right-handed parallel beta-helix repeat-containing protein [Candidatus Limnocylindrales bacterium]|nr:right-handed parallel beta-helix repeat-containing protein [Candidatus Limnocylindrales bacterium]
MRKGRNFTAVATFFVAAGLVAATAGPALAITTIYGCGSYGGANDYRLGGAVSATNTDACIKINDGRNLDTNGWTITCNRSGGCGPAVECDGSGVNSTIQSNVAVDTINDVAAGTGTFSSGVHNCGTVKDLKITGATTGILWDNAGNNGKAYQRNVILPASGGTGINVSIQDSADLVEENRIDGGSVGIRVYGKSAATGPYVRKNMVRGYSTAGIYNTDSTYFRLQDNVVIEGVDGSVPFDITSANATFTHNICADDRGVSAVSPCSCQLDRLVPPTFGSALDCL